MVKCNSFDDITSIKLFLPITTFQTI